MRNPAPAAVLALIAGCTAAPPPVADHPQAPLTEAEYTRIAAAVTARGKLDDRTRFAAVALAEPPKSADSASVRRTAEVVLLHQGTGETVEAVVELGDTPAADRVTQWKPVPGVQPLVLIEEWETGAAVTRADPAWQAAVRKRGITDPESVHLEVWASGAVPTDPPGRRLLRVLSYLREGAANPYTRPIEGVVALVDAREGKVVSVLDTGVVPVPVDSGAYRSDRRPTRADAPLAPARRGDRGFDHSPDGRSVAWGPWRFRWSMHPREALVLHDLAWVGEDGAARKILHRGSMSEMLVPYGEPDGAWNWRNAFDEGEYGLGRLATQLVPGRDAPEHAALFGAVFADDAGKPYVSADCVMIHEFDDGVLWRHADPDPTRSFGRRARKLLIGCIVTVGNYDYALNWILGPDGSIEFRIDLTGILLVKGVADAKCRQCDPASAAAGPPAPDDPQRFGKLVAAGVLAVNHLHFFNVRLDLDVDGTANTVSELDVLPAPADQAGPRGNGLLIRETVLPDEAAARRDFDGARLRCWKVGSTVRRNAQGHPTGYVLQPHTNGGFPLPAGAEIRRRAGFAEFPFHATRHRDGEWNAAGPHPNQHAGGDGLPKWAGDEPLAGQDVVVWHTFGVTHGPRPEEWPVMPVSRAGFRLLPHAFFDRNPALIPAGK